MTRRARFYARDERTSRLERAVNLVEDGYTGVKVLRSDRDRAHPLDRPVDIPPDRVTYRRANRLAEIERGPVTVMVGYGGVGDNYERPGIDTTSYAQTGGTITYTLADYGYGENGYGEFGYGGGTLVDDGGSW